jgi:hypothetical protein
MAVERNRERRVEGGGWREEGGGPWLSVVILSGKAKMIFVEQYLLNILTKMFFSLIFISGDKNEQFK